MLGDAGFERCTGERIVHRDLMLHHHQGHDVAVAGEMQERVEPIAEISAVGPGIEVHGPIALPVEGGADFNPFAVYRRLGGGTSRRCAVLRIVAVDLELAPTASPP